MELREVTYLAVVLRITAAFSWVASLAWSVA
jgi:hypothetical protein